MDRALLGLDLGEKRVGVAVVPEGTTIAFPVKMIPITITGIGWVSLSTMSKWSAGMESMTGKRFLTL